MMDKQTKKVLSDGEKLKSMCNTEGWMIAKRKLYGKINDVASILGIEKGKRSAEEVLAEIGGRQVATQMVIDWISEIEGIVLQHKAHAEVLKQYQEQEYILQVQEDNN